MEMESVGRCKLCGSPNLGDQNLKLIDDFIKQIFNVILLKLTFDDTTQELICEICFFKLSEAFDFKSTCVETEDIIFPYVNSERSKAIDLKEIYAMEKRLERESETLKDWVICRLCFQPVSSKIRDIQDVPLEIIQIYVPEVNFGVTTKALVCTKCFESLNVHGTFIKSCSAVEDKTNILIEDMLLTNSCIKTEEIKIESEETVEEETFCEILPHVVKQEEIEEGKTSIHSPVGVRNTEDAVRNVQLSVANYVKYESSSGNHENDLSKVKTHYWDECRFETNNKKRLVQHQQIHKDALEVKTFKCYKCEYVAKRKRYLVLHQLVHKKPSEVGMYKCDKCEYVTKKKWDLVKHKLVHKDPSEPLTYKCDKCTYESMFKRHLKAHQLIHKDASEVQTFKCDKCEYVTKRKGNLVKHQVIHRDPSELRMHKCDKCEYVSRRKDYLANHQLTHRDPSEVRMHKCDKCTFESKSKGHLKAHQLTHKDASEVKTFKCDKCNYVTKRKRDLVRHQLIYKNSELRHGMVHKDPSEVLLHHTHVVPS